MERVVVLLVIKIPQFTKEMPHNWMRTYNPAEKDDFCHVFTNLKQKNIIIIG